MDKRINQVIKGAGRLMTPLFPKARFLIKACSLAAFPLAVSQAQMTVSLPANADAGRAVAPSNLDADPTIFGPPATSSFCGATPAPCSPRLRAGTRRTGCTQVLPLPASALPPRWTAQ